MPRIVGGLSVIIALALFGIGYIASPVWALPPQIEQTEIKGELVEVDGPPKKKVWRETFKLKNNTGKKLTDVPVTSQPYTGAKDKDHTMPGSKTAVEQEKKVTFEIGEVKTITFDFDAPPNGAKYESWYTDAWDQVPAHRADGLGYWTMAGNYVMENIKPGPGGQRSQSFNYPYPERLELRNSGTTTIVLNALETSLPAGWSLVSFGPTEFQLSPDDFQPITVTFATAPTIALGDTAFVKFSLGIVGEEFGEATLGVTAVPEPTAAAILLSGLLGQCFLRRRRF